MQQHGFDYTADQSQMQIPDYLVRLVDQHQNRQSIVSLERRREPRNPERYDAALESLDEVDNEIDAMLRVIAKFDTEQIVGFLTAIDAVYPVADALRIANKGKPVELEINTGKAELADIPACAPSHVVSQQEYYMALANGR